MGQAKTELRQQGDAEDASLGDFADVDAGGTTQPGFGPFESRLTDLIECIPAGLVICDCNDRIVACNTLFKTWFFPGREDRVVPGMTYEEVLHVFVDSGISADGNADRTWIDRRLHAHRNPGDPFEHFLSDGRVVRTFEKRTSDGGIVSIHTDATALFEQRGAAALKSEQLEIVLESIDQGIGMLDADLNLAVFNQEFMDVLEFPPALRVAGTSFETFIRYNAERGEYGEGDVDELVQTRVDLAKKFEPHCFERTRPDGTVIEIRGNPIPGGGFVTTYSDITERRKSEDALRARELELRQQNELFNTALDNMSQGLCMFDKDRKLVVTNARFVEVYNFPEEFVQPGTTYEDMLGFLCDRDGLSDKERKAYIETRLETVTAAGPSTRIRELTGGRFIAINHQPMDNGGWVSTHEDITELQRVQARVAHMALHDELTGLPNRTLLRERMEEAEPLLRRGRNVAVLCLDLDRFKNVNDTIGHSMGDKLLQAAAERLQECVRETDTIARLGGDEFAILQISDHQPQAATALATRICDILSRPFDLENHQVVVGASVGIAIAPADGSDPDQLLKNADMALYRAKNDGRGVFRFFEPEMDARMQARRHLELDLRKALANGEFALHYQPLVDLHSDVITGFEALLRWNHAERGSVSPGDFIPIAEEIGLIIPLGEWVLRQACMDAATWPSHVKVAVNISAAQFRSENLVPTVFSALAKSGIAAHRLELEITEYALLQNNAATLKVLHALRDMGVRIAMDDFGTGYSSLSYLRSFPFDKIKIDRSFIKDLSERSDADVIVAAVADLSRNLGMVTTAEGVETREQRDQVLAAGYTEMQGFLFSAARPAEELAAYFAPDEDEDAQIA